MAKSPEDLPWLSPSCAFPPTTDACDDPNGLLAIGGELSTERLLAAYQRGIFPWYEEPQPVLWWSPNPRSVLPLEGLHISRSLRKTLRQNQLRLTLNQDFEQVMRLCGSTREPGPGTWINKDLLRVFCRLQQQGYAHSIEVRSENNELLGGLYGIALGRVFFGESMFSLQSNCSKVALVALVHLLRRSNFLLIDCQVESEHMNSMGAVNISRLDFERCLDHTQEVAPNNVDWTLPPRCGELL